MIADVLRMACLVVAGIALYNVIAFWQQRDWFSVVISVLVCVCCMLAAMCLAWAVSG